MSSTRSAIIGIGGAGLAAISCLHELGYNGAETIAVDADPEALYHARASRKILANKLWVTSSSMVSTPPSKQVAIERDFAKFREATQKDLVILVGGLGGSTGTRLIPLLAREAKDQGALVISLPIMPFHSEKPITLVRARRGLGNLAASADTVMPLLNQSLLDLPDNRPLASRFKVLDSFVLQVLLGLVGLVSNWGRINLDLADVRAVLGKQPGQTGFIGAGEFSDQKALPKKILEIFLNPLRPTDPKHVGSAVISLAGSQILTLRDVNAIMGAVAKEIAEDAIIKFGIIVDPHLKERIRITILGSVFIQGNKITRNLSPNNQPPFIPSSSPNMPD
jgi:cell division protein FtsZ